MKLFRKMQAQTAIAAMLALGAALIGGCAKPDNMTVLNGAGATFPSPVYANWSYNYSQSSQGRVLVNYQGIGSGAGVNQLKEGTIDFAGSDAPLTDEELDKNGFVQFPQLAGGIVVIVNLPSVSDGELKLSRRLLADIFLGEVTRWDDKRITALNPGIAFPAQEITVVHRCDGSGTTFLFTRYLAQISDDWREKVGCGKSVRWPVGISGQKNPGVCNNVANIIGSIGYTEYTYAVEAKLSTASLENRESHFIAPNENSFGAALAQADWNCTDIVLTDAAGEESYPLLGITYILYSRNTSNAKKEELFRYFDWCFISGNNAAMKLSYIPIPGRAIYKIRSVRNKEMQLP